MQKLYKRAMEEVEEEEEEVHLKLWMKSRSEQKEKELNIQQQEWMASRLEAKAQQIVELHTWVNIFPLIFFFLSPFFFVVHIHTVSFPSREGTAQKEIHMSNNS